MKRKIMRIKEFEWVEVEVGDEGILKCPFCGEAPLLTPLIATSGANWFGCANPDCIAAKMVVVSSENATEEVVNNWNKRV